MTKLIVYFGSYALKSKNSVRNAGRHAVFAESDMIHKQQLGYNTEDIIANWDEALVRKTDSSRGRSFAVTGNALRFSQSLGLC